MDILRLAITALIATTLIVGCDNSSAPQTTQLLQVKTKEGVHKEYWIQSYSMITQNNHVDWSIKDTVGLSLLADYQVQTHKKQIIHLDVFAKYYELQVKGLAARPSTAIQTILNKGMLYQFNLNSDQPQTVTINDAPLQQAIPVTATLKQEYQYLQFVIAPPFIPETIPLIKNQTIMVNHFMGFNQVSLKVDDITDNKVIVTLSSIEQNNKLYGKAVINKVTGWIEKMALIKDTPFIAAKGQSMRTILLMGPASWSSNEKHQLISAINTNTSSYLEPSAIAGFNKSQWQEQQQKESSATPREGQLFILNTPNAPKQLMLLLTSHIGDTSRLGQYKLDNVMVEKQPNITLLPATTTPLKTSINDAMNVATYRPLMTDTIEKSQLDSIKAISANVSFFPYQLETLTLPIDLNKEQHIQTTNKDFTLSITPTNNPSVYLMSWKNKENIIFDINLMNGTNNAKVQILQPDTVTWLTPAEASIVQSLDNSNQGRAQLTFNQQPPSSIEINLLRQGEQAAYTYPVLFK